MAPFIIKAIVSRVIYQEEAIDHITSGTSVNEDVVPTTRIKEHLAQFGLECKDTEWLEDGTQVLGLTIGMDHGEMRWNYGSRSSRHCYVTDCSPSVGGLLGTSWYESSFVWLVE